MLIFVLREAVSCLLKVEMCIQEVGKNAILLLKVILVNVKMVYIISRRRGNQATKFQTSFHTAGIISFPIPSPPIIHNGLNQ